MNNKRVKAGHVHPLVEDFFGLADGGGWNYEHIAEKSGVTRQAIWRWKKYNSPQLTSLDACLNVVGYELAIRPKRGPKRS